LEIRNLVKATNKLYTLNNGVTVKNGKVLINKFKNWEKRRFFLSKGGALLIFCFYEKKINRAPPYVNIYKPFNKD